MQYFWLCLSAFAAGAVNSVAGGGTLLSFPTLVWVLGGTAEAAVIANATSTVALLPGSLASMGGYRREFVGAGRWIRWLLLPSLAGGMVGSLLLVTLDAETFRRLVPWLILTATLLFLFQPTIAKWTGIGQTHAEPTRGMMLGIVGFQFLVAAYGGYFGAGIGILMLSALSMMGIDDIHRMNALKSLFGTGINLLAAVVFIIGGQVDWQYAWPMTIAAILGGYWGAHFARRLDRRFVRGLVIAIGFSLATYYFTGVYLAG
ncbi:MAG: sulfite exporter TauE/SafE family protein [Planctomycetaceae bacterium]|nr:sulfite exporter TauE/SafE family protein [Planctomycetaceae bacterium]